MEHNSVANKAGRALTIAALAIVGMVQFMWPTAAQTPSERHMDIETTGPGDEAIVNRAAETMLSTAASELTFFSVHKRYGTFQELQQNGEIAAGLTPESMLEGYTEYWFYGKDMSDFAIVAISDSPRLISYMIDSNYTLVVLVSPPEFQNSVEEWPLGDAVKAETKAYQESGKYKWLEPWEFNSPAGFRLLLAQDSQSFALGDQYGDSPNDCELFISTLNTNYIGQTYDPKGGHTAQGWIDAFHLTLTEDAAKACLGFAWVSEYQYQRRNDNGQYGSRSQLFFRGLLEQVTRFENMVADYYGLLWHVNENATDFAVVAMPKGDDGRLQPYMIDSSNHVMELTPADRDSVSQWPLTDVINAEAAAFIEHGAYDWVKAGLPGDRRDFDLYLSDDHKAYAFWMSKSGDENSSGAYVYLSTTDTVYSLSPAQ